MKNDVQNIPSVQELNANIIGINHFASRFVNQCNFYSTFKSGMLIIEL